MPDQLADVVPLCRAIRHDDLPGVHCPHCASPTVDDGWATVLPFGPLPRARQTRCPPATAR
ncbi:hypothetical protein [Pseudonocardia parietis]|uniref:Uncharacterized protein n=1 Tax=Pseudonocardia parietis TaxID=570936 RepID=A0ABS4VZW2_9PSEU|nr:hypothetical protein [Pseudonocardia parietis]MBP2369496.1 hypothetical protein [Pseudonocardia parietis]